MWDWIRRMPRIRRLLFFMFFVGTVLFALAITASALTGKPNPGLMHFGIVATLALFAGMGVLLSSVTSLADRLQQQADERLARVELLSERVREVAGFRGHQTEALVDQKKEKFLSIPNVSFHYANRSEITSFYNDYFKEPTIQEAVNEVVSESGGHIEAELPRVLGAKAMGRDLSRWIQTIKLPDISVGEMFRRYQREAIINDQVSLGLELVDVDLSELDAFDRLVSELEKRFGVRIDDADLSTRRAELKKRASEQTMVRLERAAGWVLVEGKFKIYENADFYTCVYDHPVSEYLGSNERKVTIKFSMPIKRVESSIAGNYAQSVGRIIPLTVYGKVWSPLDRSREAWDIQITPLAVY